LTKTVASGDERSVCRSPEIYLNHFVCWCDVMKKKTDIFIENGVETTLVSCDTFLHKSVSR
jgi:hypothetical protein